MSATTNATTTGSETAIPKGRGAASKEKTTTEKTTTRKEAAAIPIAQQPAELHAEAFLINPADLAINPTFQQLRGADYESAEFMEGLQRLARTMEEEGQKQAILIRANTQTGNGQDGKAYEIVFGHRRAAAAKLAGMEVLARFEDLTDDEAFRSACIEEFQKEQFSPLARARVMKGVRERFKLDQAKGASRKVAEFLGVSPATVTETEKLLELPEDVQQMVETGRTTATAALELARVKPEKRAEVVRVAEEKAEEEEREKPKRKAAPEPRVKLSPGLKALKEKHKERIAKERAEKAKVKTKHVRAAAKEVEGAVEKPKAPARAEIVAMHEALAGPAYPRLLVQLNEAWLKWIEGKYSDKQLEAAQDDVADVLPVDKKPPAKASSTNAIKPSSAPHPKPKVKAKGTGKGKGRGKVEKGVKGRKTAKKSK